MTVPYYGEGVPSHTGRSHSSQLVTASTKAHRRHNTAGHCVRARAQCQRTRHCWLPIQGRAECNTLRPSREAYRATSTALPEAGSYSSHRRRSIASSFLLDSCHFLLWE